MSSSPSASKPRSCAVCRSRKVRCDKLSPCSSCRRANIVCAPPADRPPRWARRLDRVTNNAASGTCINPESDPSQVMEKVRNLENLVKELSSKLEQASATAVYGQASSSAINSPGGSSQDQDADRGAQTLPITNATEVHNKFGRLVLDDSNRSRYVSNGFWSRVNDEINELKIDGGDSRGTDFDSSNAEESSRKTPSTQELERTPADRYAFLFQHNLGSSASDLRQFYPLPSQIPFLLNVYSENVNLIIQIVHLPTITKMVHDFHRSDTSLAPSNEALMFSIYYAAVTSMEEDDVMTDFGCTKAELNLKYRLGFESALARADFLNSPDIILVQAFIIFLFLVRRHDSPRFVWMITGLLIRMAQSLGLHRDGSQFNHLTPYEIEMRRKAWWAVCMLDLRSSEDQGMDLSIVDSSFDTKFPLNINDADIEPQTKETPQARQGVTDMTFAIVNYETVEIMRRMTSSNAGAGLASSQDQEVLLKEIYGKVDRAYLQHSQEAGNIAYFMAVNSLRLAIAKMTLIVYLPVLFSSPSDEFSDEIRTKLLVSAIEVAEYNHTLNSEKACRKWRWLFQTYTHWHAIVYLLIEMARRPWSPTVERAWVALHSSWLIPVQSRSQHNLRVWFPLRKLMSQARKHRDAEMNRLRHDPQAASRLEMEDKKIPVPTSFGPFPTGKSDDIFREMWRKLVQIPQGVTNLGGMPDNGANAPSIVLHNGDTTQHSLDSVPGCKESNLWPGSNVGSTNFGSQNLTNTNAPPDFAHALYPHFRDSEHDDAFSTVMPTIPLDWSGGQSSEPGIMPWLWNDTDPSVETFTAFDTNMDFDTEINWYSWVNSMKNTVTNSEPVVNHR